MLPLLLAAAAEPIIYKGLKGFAQAREADHLQLRDTTPLAFREALAMGQQGEAAALPGEAQQLNRIDAGQEATLAAGLRAGTNSSSIIDLLSRTDQNRTRALADLGTRADAFHQEQNHTLSGLLQKQGAYQKQDQLTLDENKAALKESSQRNIYGALDSASQVAAFGLSKLPEGGASTFNSDLVKTAANKLAAAPGETTTGADDILLKQRRARYQALGLPDYPDIYTADIA